MIRKIDSVLDNVKEPESGLSISQLGLIARVRYVEKNNKLYVFAHTFSNSHGCCTLLSLYEQLDTFRHLERELKKEFPEYSIEIVNAAE